MTTRTKNPKATKTTTTAPAQGDVTTTAAATAPLTTPPKATLAERVEQAMTLVQQAATLLALDAPALTPAERKRMNKLRKGGEKFIPDIAAMAQAWEVRIRTQPTEAMTQAMDTARALQPLVQLLTGFLQEVADTGLEAQGESWATATALYVILKRLSRNDPKLAAQLAPVADFFAYRHPVVAKAAAEAAAKKPGKEARRKAKEVAQAEALTAQSAPAPAPTPAPAEPAPAAAAPSTVTPASH